jgi:steroid 5-alpha reductase family enzyme
LPVRVRAWDGSEAGPPAAPAVVLRSPRALLADAQRDKLNLVCRKLALGPGDSLLDMGCGWGSLTVHAAQHYKARVTAVTLSAEQGGYASARLRGLGLDSRARVLIQDYRDAAGDSYDAIASLEMSRGKTAPGGGPFIESYVAADMHMRPVRETVGLLERAGLEVLGVESLRPHYQGMAGQPRAEPHRRGGDHRRGAGPPVAAVPGGRHAGVRGGTDGRRPDPRVQARMTGAAFAWAALAAGLSVLALVAVTFAIGALTGRHSVMDVAWGASIAVAGVTSFLASAGHGAPARRWLLLFAAFTWGYRLAWHVAVRARGAGEDPRYRELLDRAPGSRNWYALRVVYLPQLLILWVACLPLSAGMTQQPAPGVVTAIGCVAWLTGFAFEAVGDWQLARFRADPANRGQIMDRGLWRYTRHPNYFGDVCMWWGLFLIGYASPPQLLTLVSPLLMTFILTRGTGQRMTERRMSGNRQGYADYIARTSGFIPLPPRRPRRPQRPRRPRRTA